MDKYTEIEIDGKYLIPAGTKFYSNALQEEVMSDKDLVIRVVNLTAFTPGLVHGVLQNVIANPFLQMFFGAASNLYTDKTDSKISVDFKKIKKV